MSAQPEEPAVPTELALPSAGSAANHDVVVVGCSAGGVEALRSLVAALPADLPATLLVVLHLPRTNGPSLLPEILARASALPVRGAVDGAPLTPGTIVVAPPDRHLALRGGRIVLSAGPAENGCRPAVDVLFRSAAHDLGSRVVAVVMTGNLDDGSAGLRAVVRHGGEAVVQDPDDALFPGMPRNALEAVPTARTAKLDELAAVVAELVGTPAPSVAPPDEAERDSAEVELSLGAFPGPRTDDHPGRPSAWSCPDCTGVLWEVPDGPLLRFRCRTGHAWSAESLLHQQDQGVDAALWMALRALEERHALSLRVAEGAERAGRSWSAEHFGARADEAAAHAAVLRRLLVDGPGPVPLPAELPSGAQPATQPAADPDLDRDTAPDDGTPVDVRSDGW